MGDRSRELPHGRDTIDTRQLQLGFGALALVRDDAAACSVQRLAQATDNRPDQHEKDGGGQVVYAEME